MAKKLELVREQKVYRLLPGRKERRLEASGVALVDNTTALVVFDNLDRIARIHLSLLPRKANRLLPAPSMGHGFEDIAVDREGGRVLCMIEALADVDGLFRGFVAEYDTACRFVGYTRLATEFKYANKGYEGVAHVRRGGREYLFALCEGNLGTNAKRGGGRVDVFRRLASGGWEFARRIRLPKTAEFEDYAGMDCRDGRLAIVSQASARLWIGRIDAHARSVVPGSEAVYRFPKKSYGNVEGVAWLSEDTLVAVSDRKKARQPARCARKDQSIHVFRIPAGRAEKAKIRERDVR